MNAFTLQDLKRVVDACVGADAVPEFDEEAAATPFADLGLDSLAVYEAVTRIQDEYGVQVPDADLDLLKTPEQLVGFVSGRLAGTSAR
ncbi:acyl carrier protein [Streptomyces sp. NPDC050560]|uniref:acyl carrier protein n=1 Tax=Streptomyces sp. NPDC050560 TaxID=3365630 RepID=UPI0037AA7D3A